MYESFEDLMYIFIIERKMSNTNAKKLALSILRSRLEQAEQDNTDYEYLLTGWQRAS